MSKRNDRHREAWEVRAGMCDARRETRRAEFHQEVPVEHTVRPIGGQMTPQ